MEVGPQWGSTHTFNSKSKSINSTVLHYNWIQFTHWVVLMLFDNWFFCEIVSVFIVFLFYCFVFLYCLCYFYCCCFCYLLLFFCFRLLLFLFLFMFLFNFYLILIYSKWINFIYLFSCLNIRLCTYRPSALQMHTHIHRRRLKRCTKAFASN